MMRLYYCFWGMAWLFASCATETTDGEADTATDSEDADASVVSDTDTDSDSDSIDDSAEGGILGIIGLREEDHGASYTSGRLNSNFEVPNDPGTWVRARLKITMMRCGEADPYVNGSWPAFWLLGSDSSERGYGGTVSWPGCGEIDIMEWIGSYDDTHYQTNQWGSPAFPVDQNSPSQIDFSSGPETWHTYGVRFNGDDITFTFDGEDYETRSYDDADDHAHRIILNMALGGDMAGTIPDDFESDALQVDWVRVTDASGTVLFADEMDDEETTKSNWFPFIGKAYNNEEQYYTDWETDNFLWHGDSTLGECD